MNLRSFQTPDLEPVQRLIHRTIDSCYPDVYSPRAVAYFKEFHSLDRILERQAAGDVLVVEQEGAIVATGSIVGDEITGVFVHPEYQHLGIGQRVMGRLEATARAAGATAAELSVSTPSRGFYEKQGYELLGSRSIDVGEGEHLDYWMAAKFLGSDEY